MSDMPYITSIVHDAYPERDESSVSRIDQIVAPLINAIAGKLNLHQRKWEPFHRLVQQHAEDYAELTSLERQKQLKRLRYAMQRDGLIEKHTARVFAMVQQVAEKKLGLRHYAEQLMAGWVIMQGKLAEMETGEGKTLTATLPACTAALAGIPVHVVTANDYLAQRDAKLMAPVYRTMGLSVGVVTSGMAEALRRKAYACNITYGTNKQLALDYLRDRLRFGKGIGQLQFQQEQLTQTDTQEQKAPLLRGLCFAIVDEADSVLIDDARLPLVLARQRQASQDILPYQQALEIARQLQPEQDFRSGKDKTSLLLTPQGLQGLAELSQPLQGIWAKPRQREELIILALRALHQLKVDRDYVVKDGALQVIDENTGRAKPDRAWDKGLQQMLECKEGVGMSAEQEVLARITFQQFFRRYLYLAGMSGTARESALELQQVYHLEVVRIPSHRPSRRRYYPPRIYTTARAKLRYCLKHIEKVHKSGRPILVGTHSVLDSERLSHYLKKKDIPHRVLNARQDQAEAEIIAMAGQLGQITIATNIAGRGTDIELSKEAYIARGLHVISLELNDAARIDRQLFGRCARQGDPGSCIAIASLEDTLMQEALPKALIKLIQGRHPPHRPLPQRLGHLLTLWAQSRVAWRQAQQRRQLMKKEQQQEKMLAFTRRRD